MIRGPVALAAGAAIGVAYTASPLATIVTVLLSCACWAATRDLDALERRRVVAAVAVAVAIRVLAIAALLLVTNPLREQFGSFFPDARYAIERSWWIRNLWLGVPIGPMAMFAVYDTYGASSFSYLLAAVQAVVGPSPYGVDLISVAAIVVSALVLFRLARAAYGPSAAMAAFLVILFWPTLMAWSVSALREATQLALVAVALAGAVAVVRRRDVGMRVGCALAAAGAVYAIGTLRPGAIAIIAAAIPIGLAVRAATLRTSVALASAAALVVLGVVLAARPDVRAFVEYQTDLAANRHLGQATTAGHAYRLLDQRFYDEGPQSTFTVTLPEAVRFFGRAAAAFVAEPLPWRAESWSEAAAVPEQLAWYALFALAVAGLRTAWRQDALVTSLLAAYVVMGAAVIAPNSGNIGTLVRHRDTIVPAIACLAGAGLGRVRRRGMRTVGPTDERRWFDDRGRLFGRLNPVDWAGVAAGVLAIALGVATVRAFRPIAPAIDRLDPPIASPGHRTLHLEGRDLRGYLRIFVGPAGRPLVLPNPVNHGREATLTVKTAGSAELEVPSAIPAGVYDLYVYDEGHEVARNRAAFTMLPR